MDYYYVITFYSTNYVLKIERIMKKKKVDIKLIPVPRQVSSDCGLAAQLSPEGYGVFEELYKDGVIEVEGIYRVEREGKRLNFSPLEP